jgi:hypothetical protein
MEGEVRTLFNAAWEEDYDLLAKDARMLADTLRQDPTAKAEAKAQFAKLKTRANQVLAIISRKDDFARIERGAALFDDLHAYSREVRR